MTYTIDFKHADMKVALDIISEKIADMQRRVIHYKKLSGTQKVQIPDRFGNQVFEAREMVWLYEHEHKQLQGLYEEIYEVFKMPVTGRPTVARTASSRPQPSAVGAAAPSGQDEKE